MTKDGARTTCAELTAIGGTTTSIVSEKYFEQKERCDEVSDTCKNYQ
jgi:hypothetical protein